MASTRRSRRIDRRRSDRKPKRVSALVGKKRTAPRDCENGIVQEYGSGGLRIISGTPIKPEDSCVLYVGIEEKPIGAKVIWVRKQGIIEKRKSGKPGQAYVAGCKIKTAETAKPKKEKGRGAARRISQTDWTTYIMKSAFIMAGLGIIAFVVYALATLVQLF